MASKLFINNALIHPITTGIVTRCPLELRMKCQRGKGLNWGGKISYTDKDGEKQSKDLDTPECVENVVREGNYINSSGMYMVDAGRYQ